MTEHSTGNRKVLDSIPSGVEVFLFPQTNFSKVNNKLARPKNSFFNPKKCFL